MVVKATGIVVDGKVELDLPVDLPNRCPLTVIIQPIEPVVSRAKAAWEATKTRLRERPIQGGGRRFTRDDMHERD